MKNIFKDKNIYILSVENDQRDKCKSYLISKKALVEKRFSKKVNIIITSEKTILENKFPVNTATKLGIEIIDYETLSRDIERFIRKTQPTSSNGSTSTTTTTTTTTQKGQIVSFKPTSSTSTTTNVINTTTTSTTSTTTIVDPIISLIVPPSGSNNGSFQIAIFGIGFLAGAGFRIKIGNDNGGGGVFASNYEFHSSTSVLCTIPNLNIKCGQQPIYASNDGGKTFGFPIQFLFFDTSIHRIPTAREQDGMVLKSQLDNLKRAISNIQTMESILMRRISLLNGNHDDSKSIEQIFIQQQNFIESGASQLLLGNGGTTDQLLQSLEGSEYSSTNDDGENDQSDDDDDNEDDDDFVEKNSNQVKEEFSEREIKIFISSPFKDMQLDRDQIVKVVIPRIRKLCIERDIVLSYVDLRWGVTSNQSEQSTGLSMCLKELEKCNILIGLFGERYGWSSQEKQDPKSQQLLQSTLDRAIQDFPWVKNYRDSSITEIEFRMLLNQRQQQRNGFFYFRDPYYLEEVSQMDKNNFVSEGQRSKEKLEKLKQEIIKSPFKSSEYRRPTNLSDVLYEDLEKYIDKKYPSGNCELKGFEKERFLHSVFIKNLTKIYITNENYFMEIDTYLSGSATSSGSGNKSISIGSSINSGLLSSLKNKPVFLIQGESGSGKSSLISNWLKQHKEQHPEDLVVSHWIGASPSSNKFTSILIRIMNEIKNQIEIDQKIANGGSNSSSSSSSSMFSTTSTSSVSWLPEIPDETFESEKIVSEFPQFLQYVMSHPSLNGKRLVLLIDGLDKLDPRENSQELIWFPRNFPHNVKVIVSSIQGSRQSEVLKKRGSHILSILPFTEAERKSMVRLYLQKYAKKLSDQQEIAIAISKSTTNPRFLQLLLDDILVFGDYERLNDRIKTLLRAKNTSELYEIILDRIEKDYDPKAKGLVSEFLKYIWAGRRGVEMSMLSTLLLKKNIDPAEWGSLLVLMEAYITSSSGVISFLNDDISKAVEKKYITTPKIGIEIHTNLAEAFEQSGDLNERKVEEYPYQLLKSENWESLKNTLTNLYVFDKLYTPNHKVDLINYWNVLEKQTKPPKNAAERDDPIPYNCSNEFKAIISRSFIQASGLVISDVWFRVASFLEELSQFDGAEVLYNKCRELYINNSQNIEAAKVDRAMGRMYLTMGQNDKSDSKFRLALSIYTKERGQEDIEVAITLNLLGTLATNRCKFDEAKQILNQAMNICESKYESNVLLIADIAYSLGSVCFVEPNRKLEVAEAYFARSLELTESKVGDMDVAYARILTRLGSLNIEKDTYADAEAFFKAALKIYEARLGIDHSRVSQILRHMISLYEVQENYKMAEQCCIRALAITKKIYGNSHNLVSATQIRQALLYNSMNRKQDCLNLLNEVKVTREKEFGPDHKQVKHIIDLIKEIDKPIVPKAPPPPPPSSSSPSASSLLMKSITSLPIVNGQAVLSVPKPPVSRGPNGIPIPPPPPPTIKLYTNMVSLQSVMKQNVGRIPVAQPTSFNSPVQPPSPRTQQAIQQGQQQRQQVQQQQQQVQQQMSQKVSSLQQQPQQQQQQQPSQGYGNRQNTPLFQQPIFQQQFQQNRIQQPQQQPQQQAYVGDMLAQFDQQKLKRVQNANDRSGASQIVENLIGKKKCSKPVSLVNKGYMEESNQIDMGALFD
ncbi:TPR repeat-containing protein [Dictyostelium discoideum AX4]|uniref:TPR repeat-containing protein DDB_G0287407 n=1 Tax=Dictyostelium discoideum TaxID=44689 RepID=Y7407_DICDI|nr:TPR repeat-containing protein [Dictyostelium discoideum AX4]Q54KD0.1 RecName: Full=TPR repeat-containing protein DDB_G0287407 [Dictyostelium discoideum]EAL63771.1 TPR repeat-containing protein [Dictyostelium discoideum AX4]|eukprot:XP_637293.1 TPR repeat-containing protein [Dictyostelium discoideum AX4]